MNYTSIHFIFMGKLERGGVHTGLAPCQSQGTFIQRSKHTYAQTWHECIWSMGGSMSSWKRMQAQGENGDFT